MIFIHKFKRSSSRFHLLESRSQEEPCLWNQLTYSQCSPSSPGHFPVCQVLIRRASDMLSSSDGRGSPFFSSLILCWHRDIEVHPSLNSISFLSSQQVRVILILSSGGFLIVSRALICSSWVAFFSWMRLSDPCWLSTKGLWGITNMEQYSCPHFYAFRNVLWKIYILAHHPTHTVNFTVQCRTGH